MKKFTCVAAALLTLSTFANADAITDQIKARVAEFNAAYASGDADAVMEMYHDEIISIVEGSDPERDRDGFADGLASELVEYPDLNLKTDSVSGSGNYAYELGTGSYTYEGEKGVDDYLNVWKKDSDGVWKIQAEVWWGGGEDPALSKKARPEIDAQLAKIEKAWSEEDHEGVLAVYDENSIAILEGVEPIVDREEFSDVLADEVVDFPNLTFKSASLKVTDDWGFERGKASYETSSGGMGSSSYLNVWNKNSDGAWIVVMECYWGAE
jgi:ketosteroid isomerase-like protein